MGWFCFNRIIIIMKKKYFFPILFFIVNISFSQSCNELNNKVYKLYLAGKLDSSIIVAKDALLYCKKESGDSTDDYRLAADNLALLLLKKKEYLEAIIYLNISMTIELKLYGVTDNYLVSLKKIGNCWERIGDFNAAEKVYNDLNTLTKKIKGDTSTYHLDALESIAEFHFERKNYLSAQKYYYNLVDLYKKAGDERLIDWLQATNQLGLTYFNLSEFEMAIYYFNNGLDKLKNSNKLATTTFLLLIDNLALANEQNKNYTEAKKYYLEEIDFRKKTNQLSGISFPLTHLGRINYLEGNYQSATDFFLQDYNIKAQSNDLQSSLSTIRNLALLYDKIGDTISSFKMYHLELDVKRKLQGENSLEYLKLINILGVKYYNIKNLKNAEELYLKALSIRKKNNFFFDSGYVYLMRNIILCYSELGDFNKAELYNNYFKRTTDSLAEISSSIYNNFSCDSLNKKASLLFKEGNLGEAIKIADFAIEKCGVPLDMDSSFLSESAYTYGIIYLDFGRYEKCEYILSKQLAYIRDNYGKLNFNYRKILGILITILKLEKKYAIADSFSKELVLISRINYGQKHPYYAIAITTLAKCYVESGHYNEAEELLLEALKIYKDFLGEESIEYNNQILELASIYESMKLYVKSESYYTKGNEKFKIKYGEQSIEYTDKLDNLGLMYQKSGQFLKAEKIFIKTSSILKKIEGEKSKKYLESLNNLAAIYNINGNYKQAKEIYLQLISLGERRLGVAHPDLASYLNDLALIYSNEGDYNKSIDFYKKASVILKTIFGEESDIYALSMNNIGSSLLFTGDLEEAEITLQKALSLREKLLGKSHPDVAMTKVNLSLFYCQLGDVKKALNFCKEALNIFKENKMNEMVGACLNNLGIYYTIDEDYSKAEEVQLQALKIKKDVLGENHPDYAKSLLGIGLNYLEKEKYKEAEQYLLQSVLINRNNFGEANINYARAINFLGLLYLRIGNFTKGETLLEQSLKIYTKQSGINNIEIISPILGFNYLYECTHNIQKADSTLAEALSLYKKNLLTTFGFLSSNQGLEFIKNKEKEISVAFSYALRNTNSEIIPLITDFNLAFKNIQLLKFNQFELIASKSNDSSTLNNWNNYNSLKKEIIKMYQLPVSQQINLKELENELQLVEKEVLKKLPKLKEQLNKNNTSWKDIQTKLKPGEVSIDFISFRYHNMKNWTDTTRYCAIIIKPEEATPEFISLFYEKELSEILENANNNLSLNQLYDTANKSLYNLIWKPLEGSIKNAKRIYLSASGLLHRISFSAIPSPAGDKLIDKYEIQVLSNTRTIAENNSRDTTLKSITLFGDIDYSNVPSLISDIKTTEYKFSDSISLSNMRSLNNGIWKNLPSTSTEIFSIQQIASNTKIITNSFTKQNASEENFKKLQSPSILHVATHGFAAPSYSMKPKELGFTSDNAKLFQRSEDALTRAGLILAGGNQMWRTGRPYMNHEDGILTAREVSGLDLSSTILTTLSACETGLGEIKGSEGVFGLQRAFKMAGVHYLIVSLWKVPDAETADFMTTFYGKWLKNKTPIKEAFRQTQIEMNKKYIEPYNWAGFVLVE